MNGKEANNPNVLLVLEEDESLNQTALETYGLHEYAYDVITRSITEKEKWLCMTPREKKMLTTYFKNTKSFVNATALSEQFRITIEEAEKEALATLYKLSLFYPEMHQQHSNESV